LEVRHRIHFGFGGSSQPSASRSPINRALIFAFPACGGHRSSEIAIWPYEVSAFADPRSSRALRDGLHGWAYEIRTAESARELSNWNSLTTSPESAQARRRRPIACLFALLVVGHGRRQRLAQQIVEAFRSVEALPWHHIGGMTPYARKAVQATVPPTGVYRHLSEGRPIHH
jgi:hypothetical protein